MNEGQRRTMTERSVINAAAVSVKTKFLQEKKILNLELGALKTARRD
jgi:hypothetical protein